MIGPEANWRELCGLSFQSSGTQRLLRSLSSRFWCRVGVCGNQARVTRRGDVTEWPKRRIEALGAGRR
jgi:hypothetical protein